MKKQDKEMASSPLPKKVVFMDFPDAMRAVMNGEMVRRASWPEGEFVFLADGWLQIEKNGTHRWWISDGDFMGDDWVTV